MDETRQDQVRAYWMGVWDNGGFGLASDFYAPLFRMNEVEMTPLSFAQTAGAWRMNFTRFDVEVLKLLRCGDSVVSRTRYTVMATGAADTSVITGIDIFDFEGDRVRDHWHETDHTMFATLISAPNRATSV